MDMDAPRIDYDFNGATVCVTGGTSGIGKAIATAYRDANAWVTITGTRKAMSEYEDLHGFDYIQLDVENQESIDSAARQFSTLDILINNAGLSLSSLGLDEHEPEVFTRAINMLLTSVFRMSHRCHGALKKSRFPGGASVIGIASMSSYFGIPAAPGYAAAKTGLLGLTRSLATAWAADGIRSNAVAAGLIRSRMTEKMIADPKWRDPTLARTPLGRLGEPEDIAGPVLFLTSPAASWITGQAIVVDGGFTIAR